MKKTMKPSVKKVAMPPMKDTKKMKAMPWSRQGNPVGKMKKK